MQPPVGWYKMIRVSTCMVHCPPSWRMSHKTLKRRSSPTNSGRFAILTGWVYQVIDHSLPVGRSHRSNRGWGVFWAAAFRAGLLRGQAVAEASNCTTELRMHPHCQPVWGSGQPRMNNMCLTHNLFVKHSHQWSENSACLGNFPHSLMRRRPNQKLIPHKTDASWSFVILLLIIFDSHFLPFFIYINIIYLLVIRAKMWP